MKINHRFLHIFLSPLNLILIRNLLYAC